MTVTSVQPVVNSSVSNNTPPPPQQQQQTVNPDLPPGSAAVQSGGIQIPPNEPPLVQALLTLVSALVQVFEANPNALSGLGNLQGGSSDGSQTAGTQQPQSLTAQQGGGGDGSQTAGVQQPQSFPAQPGGGGGEGGSGINDGSGSDAGAGATNAGAESVSDPATAATTASVPDGSDTASGASSATASASSPTTTGVSPGSFGTPPQPPGQLDQTSLSAITTKDGSYSAWDAYQDMQKIQQQGGAARCSPQQLMQMAAGMVQGVNTYMPNASDPKKACQWLEAETWAESSYDPNTNTPNAQGQNLGPLQVANAWEGNFLQKAGIPNQASTLTDPYWGVMAGIACIAQQRDGSTDRAGLSTAGQNASTLGGAAYLYNGNPAQVDTYLQHIQSVTNTNFGGDLSGVTF